jgi:hypothetical protein
LRTQRISISLELREGLPQLIADRGQLQQVFLNLCANAIEAMRFVDRARLLRIRSDIIKESSYIMVTIEDSGSGIDGKNRDRIFEPFFTTKSSGTGIGLSICQSIIESHGGGAFKCLRTILTGRSFMSHCQAATHEGGDTGTLVAPKIVVTAAHCVINQVNQKPFQPSDIHFLAAVRGSENKGHATAQCLHFLPNYRLLKRTT